MDKDSKEEVQDDGSKVVRLGPNLVGSEHYFVRNGKNEAECTKCPLGYILSLGNEIKDGRIYMHGELVI